MSLSQAMSHDLGYNESAKSNFIKEAKKALRKVAKSLGFSSLQYNVSVNIGGVATSGEVTLKVDGLYILVRQSSMGKRGQVLFRSYDMESGKSGNNNYMTAWELESGEKSSELKRVGSL
jgi:hypothetical protein